MVEKGNKSRYIITSSDSETSDYEYEHLQNTMTNQSYTASSQHKRHKYSHFLPENQIEQDNRLIITSDSEISESQTERPQRITTDQSYTISLQNLPQLSRSSSEGRNEEDNTDNNISSFVHKNENILQNNNNNLILNHTDDDQQTSSQHNSSTRSTQTTIDRYFPYIKGSFENIDNLNQNTINFNIRCKVIYKSAIRLFGLSNKVFDAIVCDNNGEIKLVAFNEDADRFYNVLNVNQMFTIQNGKIEMANENFRSPYSPYQIRLVSFTNIKPYTAINFKPLMKITKQELFNIHQKVHGANIGRLPYLIS